MTITTLALAACGGAEDPTAEEPVELRFAFWGSDARVQNTQEIIDTFEAAHPEIQIEMEYSDWDGFWDQLNTQMAGGDTPDIFQMDAPYLREYAERDMLMDLSEVDLSEVPDDIVESGTIDGEYFGLASGVTAPVFVANPRLFDEADVGMPDDTTWTWDDYAQLAQDISENVDGVYGSSGPEEPRLMQSWLRQQDSQLTTEAGELGFGVTEAQEYLSWQKDLLNQGAIPSASEIVEDNSATADQSLIATGQSAMAFSLTNLLGGLSDASGDDLELLRMPSPTGEVQDAEQWYNTGMVSASSQTEHPEAVVTFLDFFVNDLESARINMADRGLSANTAIRPDLMEEMDEPNREAADFLTEIEDELGPAEPVPATGQGALGEIITRYQDEVFFERMSPEDAAEALVTEAQAAVG
ncbi:ABC transporter substrate-binding protein [Nesterenkonia halotolerans]|uniref:ABC transporter substrate-binding protein n=1 Tax=Nesterenkonia halotolerans TaxID=225325 RepID=UPI003EE60B3C